MKICVIGTGTMGSGIVQAFAQAGVPVLMKSRSEASNQKAVAKITKSLAKLVEKGKVTEEYMNSVLGNITTTAEYSDLADCDLIIEAAVETMELKRELFAQLDQICKPEAILASNTSSLSITEIAGCTSRPEQVIGMHFFNPAPVMKLVELIKGQRTSDEVADKIKALAESIGKVPIMVNEAPGLL